MSTTTTNDLATDPQTGFALPSAIFLLVILSLLAAFLLRVSVTSDSTTQMDVQGTRAYHIAKAGIERQLYAVLDPKNAVINAFAQSNSGVAVTVSGLQAAFPACPANLSTTLEGFNLSTVCTQSYPFREGADRVIFTYTISASASQGTVGQEGYVERAITTDLALCRSTLSASSTPVPFLCTN